MLATTYGMRHHAGKSVRREGWVSRPAFAKRVEVLVCGIFEEGIERPARRPFDKDHDRPRFDTWLRLHHISQPSERHDLSAVLFRCCHRTARILAVEVVF